MTLACVAVDLAAQVPSEIGVAVLRESRRGVSCELTNGEALGLTRATLSPSAVAQRLLALAGKHDAQAVVIDGPAAWAADALPPQFRIAERVLRTPGKLYGPGDVRPRTWLRFAEFSLALFDELEAGGYRRLGDAAGFRADTAAGQRWAIETFPSAFWSRWGRTIGVGRLPQAGRRDPAALESHTASLSQVVRWARPPCAPSHDELQAVVAGLPCLSALGSRAVRCGHEFAGAPLTWQGGTPREGYILAAGMPPEP